MIASDFMYTALPDVTEAATKRLSKLAPRKSKAALNRKTVVAPFIGGVTTSSIVPGEGDTIVLGPSNVSVPGSGGSSLIGPNNSSSISSPSGSSTSGPRMSTLDSDTASRNAGLRQQKGSTRQGKPVNLTRKSTARKSEDLF